MDVEEWRMLCLVSTSRYLTKSRANRRTMELRVLLAEVAFAFKTKTALDIKHSDQGTYDVLKAARKTSNTLTSPNEVTLLETILSELLDLDKAIEHGSVGRITADRWRNGINAITRLAQLFAFDNIRNICRSLEQMERNDHRPRNDFMYKIWRESEYLRRIPSQRETLLTFFINLMGFQIRMSLSGITRVHSSYRNLYCKGDKEIFKEVAKYKTIRDTIFKNSSIGTTTKVRKLVQLRGFKRHVVLKRSNLTLAGMNIEIKILLKVAQGLLGNVELVRIFQSAQRECNPYLSH